nr:hypothetical protein CparaKRNrm2_p063 [Cryptomonas paramecium]
MRTNVLFYPDFSLHFLIDLSCNQQFSISRIFCDMFKENFLSHFFLFYQNFIRKKTENFIHRFQFFLNLGDKIMILIQSANFRNYYDQIFTNGFNDYFFILQIAKKNIPFDIKLFLNSHEKIKCIDTKAMSNRYVDNCIIFFILFLFKKFKNSIYTFTENLNFTENRFKFLFEWIHNIRKYDYWHKVKTLYLDCHCQFEKNISQFFPVNKKLSKNSKNVFSYLKDSFMLKYHKYKLLRFFKKKFEYNHEKYVHNRIFHSFLNTRYLALYKISKPLSKDIILHMI